MGESEPSRLRKPGVRSEPDVASNPSDYSEPFRLRKPGVRSVPFVARSPSDVSAYIFPSNELVLLEADSRSPLFLGCGEPARG